MKPPTSSVPPRSLRRTIGRWSGRLLLLLASCELTLRGVARVAPRLFTSARAVGGAIVCVGDSNTAGVGATRGHSYPDQLHELLAASGCMRDVVDLGWPGFESWRAVDRLESSLGTGRPAIVPRVTRATNCSPTTRRPSSASTASIPTRRATRSSRAAFDGLRELAIAR